VRTSVQNDLSIVPSIPSSQTVSEAERSALQSQIDSLRQQLSWTTSAAEQYVYEEKMKAARLLQEEIDNLKVKFHAACSEYDHQQRLLRETDQLQIQSMDHSCRAQVESIKTQAELAMQRCLHDRESTLAALHDSEANLKRTQDEANQLCDITQRAQEEKRNAELALQSTYSQASAAIADRDSMIQSQAIAAQTAIARLRADFENQLRLKDQEKTQLEETYKKRQFDLLQEMQDNDSKAEITRLDLAQQLASKKQQHQDTLQMMESFRSQLVEKSQISQSVSQSVSQLAS